MMKSPRPFALLACLLVAGAGAIGEITIVTAGAWSAEIPPSPTGLPGTAGLDGRVPLTGGNEMLQGAGNYDYFSAHLRSDLQSYLSQVTARHASERVWALYWAGKYTEPLGDCEYALARFPNHPRALHLLGEIAKATNQLSIGISYFEYALSLYPQYAFTHAQYGHYLIEIGAVPAGVEQLREALRIDPGQFQAKAWLAQALGSHPELGKEAPGDGSGESASERGTDHTKGR